MRLEEEIGILLKERKVSLSTAESCTGGGIAAIITSVPGSSAYFKGGIVAYDTEVKKELLQVPAAVLEKHGVVSEQTVICMAKGAMNALKTECAIATSGIAGPGGDHSGMEIGTIWIAVAYKNEILTMKQEGDYGRRENIRRAIENALSQLREVLK